MNANLGNIVFLYGSGRSGTTLLAKLIDASRQIVYRHEPDKVCPDSSIPFLPEPDRYGELLAASRSYLLRLVREHGVSVSGKLPVFEKNYRSRSSTLLIRGLVPVLTAAEAVHIHIPLPDLFASQDIRYLIKSVSSICRVPLFAGSVPEMKCIHIVRHPAAMIGSLLRGIAQHKVSQEVYVEDVLKMSNAGEFPFSREDVLHEDFAGKHAYAWMVQNDKSHREMAGGENYFLVSYEDLCVNMHERMSELCSFLGLEFDDQMVGFIDSILKSENNPGYFSIRKNPLSNIDRWEQSIGKETGEKITRLIAHSEVGRFVLQKYAAAKDRLA